MAISKHCYKLLSTLRKKAFHNQCFLLFLQCAIPFHIIHCTRYLFECMLSVQSSLNHMCLLRFKILTKHYLQYYSKKKDMILMSTISDAIPLFYKKCHSQLSSKVSRTTINIKQWSTAGHCYLMSV